MAFPGVFISTILFAVSLHVVGLGAEIPFSGLLVIASVLGSTDPIAVGALLKELGAPHKLNILLEGEALINDGTSLICFQVFVDVYKGKTPTVMKVLLDLCTLCIGGPVLGVVVGFLFYLWMRRTIKDGVLLVCMTFVNCFLVFFLCEYFPWNLSGILAIVSAALVQASKGKIEIMADELWFVVETVWKFAQFVGESMLFVLTGIFIGNEFARLHETVEGLFWLVLKIFGFFLLMNISRFLMVVLFLPFYNSKSSHHEYKIGIKQAIVIAYSGIRGAFPLIIVLMIAKNEEFPEHFRQVAVIVTIMTITLGVILNGMTVKSLINYLEIIPINPIHEKWQSVTQKDIYNKLTAEIEVLKRKPDLAVASWRIVRDLCGLKQYSREIDLQDNRLRSTEIKFFSSSNNLLLIETRMRILCFFKNFVLEQLKGAHFSTQSANVLIEIADFSEETSYNSLGLWHYLEDYIKSSFSLSILAYLMKFERAEPYVRHMYYKELSSTYETIFNFTSALDAMISDKTFLENIPIEHAQNITLELEEQRLKAENFNLDLTSQNQIVIQLYQTKRACKELLHKRRKFVKELFACGILEESELQSMMGDNKQMIARVEAFSFGVNEVFIREIFDSNAIFSELSSEDKERLFRGYRKLNFEPQQYIFRHGDYSEGIYMILDGSAEEIFSNQVKKLRLFGSLLGVRFFIDDQFRYHNDLRCLTNCTVALFPIELLQRLIPENPQMEKSIYYSCLLNILVEKEQQSITADSMMNMIDYFEIHHLRRGKRVEVNNGFLLLKGKAKRTLVADRRNPDFRPTGERKSLVLYEIELNNEHLTYELFSDNEATVIDFKMKSFKELDSIRGTSMRQSQNIFNEADKIQKTFERMTTFMKFNS